jgi:hypothetical protein
MQSPDHSNGNELKEASQSYRTGAAEINDGLGLSLDDSLAMTVWERIQANDDMVNFGDSLRAAMEKRNAESR